MVSNLLISEPPLQVLPSLAVKVGLNEAIILQQFHYWLQRSNNIRDGNKWIYNSYPKWGEQFPFWSLSTLKRAITSLEDQGYLISGNYNVAGFDKTKWYRIDYEKLVSRPSVQNEPTNGSERTDGAVQNEPTNTNRLPESTTETTKDSCPAGAEPHPPYQEIIDYLNERTGKQFKNSKTNQGLIRPRFNEGYTLDDFKLVIDNQTVAWNHEPEPGKKDMREYLRPSTLFRASNFDGYRNNKPKERKESGSYGGIKF